jgi:hypothetical protein
MRRGAAINRLRVAERSPDQQQTIGHSAGAAGAESSQCKPRERRHAASHHDAAAAAMLSGAVMAATSAKAGYNYGPLKNGTQCYKMSANGWNNQGYGYWAPCPGPAAAPAVNPSGTVHHHDTHQSKRS